MDEPVKQEVKAPPRLCSEIRLFDLCELDSCTARDGRFCTDPQLLRRFEAIAEKDETSSDRFSDVDELDEDELSDDYDDEQGGVDDEDADEDEDY